MSNIIQEKYSSMNNHW